MRGVHDIRGKIRAGGKLTANIELRRQSWLLFLRCKLDTIQLCRGTSESHGLLRADCLESFSLVQVRELLADKAGVVRRALHNCPTAAVP